MNIFLNLFLIEWLEKMRFLAVCAIFFLLGVFSCDVPEEFCVSGTSEFSCSLEKTVKWLPADLFSSIGGAIVVTAVLDFGFNVSVFNVI